MALAEDAVGKIRREVETGGERSLRLREEPCGEEQAEIIGGQQSMRCDGILKSVKDRFWHAGGERGQFQILMRIGKKKIPHCCSRRKSAPSWYPLPSRRIVTGRMRLCDSRSAWTYSMPKILFGSFKKVSSSSFESEEKEALSEK